MSDKQSDVINNICTILGGALLLYPLIDQASKTIIPEMQKLTSGEVLDPLKLPEHVQDKEKEKEKPDLDENQIAELKRKLQEYEEKEKLAQQERQDQREY